MMILNIIKRELKYTNYVFIVMRMAASLFDIDYEFLLPIDSEFLVGLTVGYSAKDDFPT
jgi:hypothetical protein